MDLEVSLSNEINKVINDSNSLIDIKNYLLDFLNSTDKPLECGFKEFNFADFNIVYYKVTSKKMKDKFGYRRKYFYFEEYDSKKYRVWP